MQIYNFSPNNPNNLQQFFISGVHSPANRLTIQSIIFLLCADFWGGFSLVHLIDAGDKDWGNDFSGTGTDLDIDFSCTGIGSFTVICTFSLVGFFSTYLFSISLGTGKSRAN
jgi:hypothetical protein